MADDFKEVVTNVVAQVMPPVTAPVVAPVTAPVVTPQVTPETKANTISVDIFGVAIDLPVDKAKELILKRDERSTLFNGLKSQVNDWEAKANDATRKASAIEAARNGDVAAAEELFNQKLNAQVNRYKGKVVDAEIQSSLLSNPAFLDTHSNRQDALALIKASNVFELDEDNNVKSSDKTVADIVNDFVNSRDAFKKAAQGNPNRARVMPVLAPKQVLSLADGFKAWQENNK